MDSGTDAETPDGGVDPDPEPINVQGVVVDKRGIAAPGVTVLVAGGAAVVTDVGGGFQVDGITPPYNVLIMSAAAQHATLYVDVMRPDPVLELSVHAGEPRTATVEAPLVAGPNSGFVTPTPPGGTTATLFHGARVSSGGFVTAGHSAATVYNYPDWAGPSTTTGTLHVLQYTSTNGRLDEALGYAQRLGVSLTAGVVETLSTTSMLATSVVSLSGSVDVQSDNSTVAQISSGIVLLAGGSFSLSTSTGADPVFEHVAPLIAGARGYVGVTALVNTPGVQAGVISVRANLALPSTDIVVTVPDSPLPLPLAPLEGTAGVGAGSELRWQAVPGGVHLLRLAPIDSGSASARLLVVTPRDRVTLPDLAPFGVLFGGAEEYEWRVQTVLDASSDDATELGFISGMNDFLRDYVLAAGSSRTFITP